METEAARLLAALRPLAALPENSFRFVAMPSFGECWFAIALGAGPREASGTIVIIPNKDEARDCPASGTRRFHNPGAAFAAMTAKTGPPA